MMAARDTSTVSLLDRLPAVRGRYTPDYDLSKVTWFRVGGPAEVLFRPADADDLVDFLRRKPADVPLTVVGVGSNLLVRDGGVPGVVVRLVGAFAEITPHGETVTVGAGALDVNVAETACAAGIAGLEFFSGIPGTIGGALRMNAGAYGGDMACCLVSAEAVDRSGERHSLSLADMGFTYRHSGVPADWLFLSATLHGFKDAPAAIAQRMDDIKARREATQPIRTRTGGSTFANPPATVNPQGYKAWQLIDSAGCRGLTRGGAMVSTQHCNFLLNTGSATAADLEGLGEEVRRRVLENSGITLEWEIRRIGEAL